MNYHDFQEASARSDKVANNNTHYFSTHFAIPCAFLLHKTGLSPNQATFLFGVVGLLSAMGFWSDHFLIGWLLWRLHIIIDMADGSIARATKRFSIYADGFDKSIHIIVNTSVIIGLASLSGDFLNVNILLIAFYLYYLQNKIFSAKPAGTTYFSIPKNIAKDIVSLEGFIVASWVLDNADYQFALNISYSLFFLILFTAKCRKMLLSDANS